MYTVSLFSGAGSVGVSILVTVSTDNVLGVFAEGVLDGVAQCAVLSA